MKVSVEETGPCRKTIRIEVPAADVSAKYDEILATFARMAKVPGFRPGRAPKELVARRFAKDITGELRDTLVPDYYHKAIKDNKIHSIAIMGIDEPEPPSPLKDFVFSVTMDVPPEFKLPEYKGIPIRRDDTPVSDEDVNGAIETLRRQAARYEEVTDRPAQAGDLVQVDFEGTLDGQPVETLGEKTKGLGKAQGHWVSADPDSFPPGMGDGIVGAAIGESRDVRCSFREKFPAAELAGKTADYHVTIKAIRAPVLPEINEEFCKPFGADSADALLARVRQSLERSRNDNETSRRRNEAVGHLLSRTSMELPESLVKRETEQNVYRIVSESVRQGVAQDNIVDHKSKIFENANRSAMDTLKSRYILGRIAEAEAIEVTDEELVRDIEKEAARSGADAAAVLKRAKDEGTFEEFRRQLREQKALDRVLEMATTP